MTEAYKQLKQRADASWDTLVKGSPGPDIRRHCDLRTGDGWSAGGGGF